MRRLWTQLALDLTRRIKLSRFRVFGVVGGLFLLLLLLPQVQERPGLTEATQTDRRRSIMGAYWTLADGFSSTLMLTNTSNELLQIEPEVYNLQGQRLDLPEIKLREQQRLILDVKQWLATGDVKTAQSEWPGPIADDQAQSEISNLQSQIPGFTSGSLILKHRGGTYALAAQLTITDPARSLSFDFPVEPSFYKYESTRLEGLWWLMDNQSDAKVVLTNLSETALSLRPTFTLSGKALTGTLLALGAHETKVMTIDDLLKLARAVRGSLLQGGLAFEHTGEPGDLRAYCLMSNRRGFSTTMELADPEVRKSNSLHAAGVLMRQMTLPGVTGTKLNTLLLLTNTTGQEVTVRVNVNYTLSGGVVRAVRLPVTKLTAHEVRRIDLGQMVESAARLPQKIESAGIDIQYGGKPGSVIAYGVSFDDSTSLAFDLLVKDVASLPTNGFSFPWRLDGDRRSLIQIKNTEFGPGKLWIKLIWNKGEYEIGSRTLGPGETLTIDIAELKEKKIPDQKGRIIPREVTAGEARWYDFGNSGLIGRVTIYSPKTKVNTSTNELSEPRIICCIDFTPGQPLDRMLLCQEPNCGGPAPLIDTVVGDTIWLATEMPVFLKTVGCCSGVFEEFEETNVIDQGTGNPVITFSSSDTVVATVENFGSADTLNRAIVVNQSKQEEVRITASRQNVVILGCYRDAYGDCRRSGGIYTSTTKADIRITASNPWVQIKSTSFTSNPVAIGSQPMLQVVVEHSAMLWNRQVSVSVDKLSSSPNCVAAAPTATPPAQTIRTLEKGSLTFDFPFTTGDILSSACGGTVTYKATVSISSGGWPTGIRQPVNDQATLTIQPTVQIAETKFVPTEAAAGSDALLNHKSTLQVTVKTSAGVTGTFPLTVMRSTSASCVVTTPTSATDSTTLVFPQPAPTGNTYTFNFLVDASSSTCAGTATYSVSISPVPGGQTVLYSQSSAVLTVTYWTVQITSTRFSPTSVGIGGAATTLTVTVAHSASMANANVTVQIQQMSTTPSVAGCTDVQATPTLTEQPQPVPSTRTTSGALTYTFQITPGGIDSTACPGTAAYKASITAVSLAGVAQLAPTDDSDTLTIQPSVQMAETAFLTPEVYGGSTTPNQSTLQVRVKKSQGVTAALTVALSRTSTTGGACVVTSPTSATDTTPEAGATANESLYKFTISAGSSTCGGTATYRASFSTTPSGVVVLTPQDTATLTILYRTVKITATTFNPTTVSLGGAATTLTVTVTHSASMANARVTVQVGIAQNGITPSVAACTNVTATVASATQAQTVPSSRTGTGTLTYTFTITPPGIDSTGCPGTINYQASIASVTGVTGAGTLAPTDDQAPLTIKPSVQIIGTTLTPTSVATGTAATLAHQSTLQVRVKASRGVSGTVTVQVPLPTESASCVSTTTDGEDDDPVTKSVTFSPATTATTVSSVSFSIQVTSTSCAGTATYKPRLSAVPTTVTALAPTTGADTAVLTIVAAPWISSVTPTSGQQGQSLTVTLSGSNLAVTGAPVVTINQAQMLVTVTSATATQIRTTVGIPWSTPPSSYTLTVTFPQIGFLTRSFSVAGRMLQAPVISSLTPAKVMLDPITIPEGATAKAQLAAVAKGSCVQLRLTGQNLVGATVEFLQQDGGGGRPLPTIVRQDRPCSGGQFTDAINYSDTGMTVWLDTSGTEVVGFYTLLIHTVTPAKKENSAAIGVEVISTDVVVREYAPHQVVRSRGKQILMIYGSNLQNVFQLVESPGSGPPLLDFTIESKTSEFILGTISVKETAPNPIPASGLTTDLRINGDGPWLDIKVYESEEQVQQNESQGTLPAVEYGAGIGKPGNPFVGGTTNASASSLIVYDINVGDAFTLHSAQATKVFLNRINGNGELGVDLPSSLGLNGAVPVGGYVASAYIRVDAVVMVQVRFDPYNPIPVTNLSFRLRTVAGGYISGGRYVLFAHDWLSQKSTVKVDFGDPSHLQGPVIEPRQGCVGVGPLGIGSIGPGIFSTILRNTNGWSGCCGGQAKLTVGARVKVMLEADMDWENFSQDSLLPFFSPNFEDVALPPTDEPVITLETYAFSPRITGVSIDRPIIDSDDPVPAKLKVDVEIPKAGSATDGMQNPGLWVKVDTVVIRKSNPATEVVITPGDSSSGSKTQFVQEGAGAVSFYFDLDPVDTTDEGDVTLETQIGNNLTTCANPFMPTDPSLVTALLVVKKPPARAHIEATVFDPLQVTAGTPSNLVVTVHHGLRMEGMQIPVQVAAQAGSNPCVATTPVERMAQVPATRRGAGTVTVTFPFTTTACQVSTQVQVTYQASIPTGRGIIVNMPADDYDILTVNAPPRLEITVPAGREATAYILHEADGFPSRPPLYGVSAKVVGVTPDPTPTTTFRWKLRVQYDTKEINFRSKEVVWERVAQGGALPPDFFEACGKMVGETSAVTDDRACVAGGNLLFEVRATVNGKELMASKEGPVLLAGNNPPKSAIQARLTYGTAEQTEWLQKMACWESQLLISGIPFVSGQRQFAGPDYPQFYQHLGEPLMNTIGDGGAGIMQITIPRPTSSELWDWRANVDRGKDIFDEKLYGTWKDSTRTERVRNGADDYPQNVRTSDGFDAIKKATNEWRQSQGLEPLVDIVVPDFGMYNVEEPDGTRMMRNLLVEDAVRGFNGWAGTGQFGFARHEFRLKTTTGRLEVENEQVVNGRRMADAIWIRVPPDERTINKTYVNDVRTRTTPLCP
jgi:hypothetical protein